MMEQIKRKILVMRLVRHPNIGELKEVMATKSKIYIIMEYVRGGELFAKVARGRLKEDAAKKYFQQMISAFDFCHSHGVIHRDLKPENMFLDENEDLKISDLGLSALYEHRCKDGLLHTQCETPAYMAPEVLKTRGYDGAKADLWSCGVILYVILVGFIPFQDENLSPMYKKIFRADYEFLPWLSTDAKRIVSKLLVVDPGRRIGIQGIMRTHWFRKGFKRSIAFSMQESIFEKFDEEEKSMHETIKKSPSSQAFLNAFQFISSGLTCEHVLHRDVQPRLSWERWR